MAVKRVVVDPITRIEGHLRIEAMLGDDGKIGDAMSSGTMWRGIEVIVQNRDPRECGRSSSAFAASVRRCMRSRASAP
ncbi:MAG: hypothetical protein R2748_32005 [Bryobacterales bacterium]